MLHRIMKEDRPVGTLCQLDEVLTEVEFDDLDANRLQLGNHLIKGLLDVRVYDFQELPAGHSEPDAS